MAALPTSKDTYLVPSEPPLLQGIHESWWSLSISSDNTVPASNSHSTHIYMVPGWLLSIIVTGNHWFVNKQSLSSSSSARSSQVECMCVWLRFYENHPTATIPLSLLKGGMSKGGPLYSGPSHSCNQCIKQTLSSRSWEPASIHHVKHECRHTHTHRVGFIKATDICWPPAFCQIPETCHLAFKPVALIRKRKQSLPMASCLRILNENSSSCILL